MIRVRYGTYICRDQTIRRHRGQMTSRYRCRISGISQTESGLRSIFPYRGIQGLNVWVRLVCAETNKICFNTNIHNYKIINEQIFNQTIYKTRMPLTNFSHDILEQVCMTVWVTVAAATHERLRDTLYKHSNCYAMRLEKTLTINQY